MRPMGELIFRFEGTLERFTGTGYGLFNDPVPALTRRRGPCVCRWHAAADAYTDRQVQRRGHVLDFGWALPTVTPPWA